MAQLMPFAYIHGDSLLHRLDARLKFFIICLVSISVFHMHFQAGMIYFLILILLFKRTGLNLYTMLKTITYFMVLLVFIVIARAMATKGNALFSIYGISFTEQGFNEGGMVAFKFFMVMLTGMLFSSTTKPSSIKSAVQWILKPVPFVPEKRVAVMISLSLAFMPIIMKQAKEISNAQKARCGDLQRNPVKKLFRLAFPLLKKIFLSADSLILAMESRCYSEDRTDPEFNTPSANEFFFFAFAIILSGILVYL